MKPIEFKQQTKILRPPTAWDEGSMGKCESLPVFADGMQVISCWRLTWRERLKALFIGKLWVFVISGQTQPPIGFHVGKTVFEDPK